MNLVEQFAGKRKPERQEPATVPIPQRPPPALMSHEQLERTAQALAFLGDFKETAERLKIENANLREHLRVAHHRCADLEQQLADQRYDLERYRRYSVEVKTHLQHIVDCATRANDCALDAGDDVVPKQAQEIISKVEEELREPDVQAEKIARKFAPREQPDE